MVAFLFPRSSFHSFHSYGKRSLVFEWTINLSDMFFGDVLMLRFVMEKIGKQSQLILFMFMISVFSHTTLWH